MQWNRDSSLPDTDGFEIKRFGTEPIRVWVRGLRLFIIFAMWWKSQGAGSKVIVKSSQLLLYGHVSVEISKSWLIVECICSRGIGLFCCYYIRKWTVCTVFVRAKNFVAPSPFLMAVIDH